VKQQLRKCLPWNAGTGIEENFTAQNSRLPFHSPLNP
jgi:hypothetical protein